MTVEFGTRPEFEILRHSGTHACEDQDHAEGDRVREHVIRCVQHGRSRILADVRDLRVVFGSGISDLVNAWTLPGEESRPIVAVLWRPQPGELFDRWGHLNRSVRKQSEHAREVASGPPGRPFIAFFLDEAEAVAFLGGS